MKKHLLFCLLPLVFTARAQTVTFPVNGPPNPTHTLYAFTNANICADPDSYTLIQGTLLVKDGIVVDVVKGNSVPKDAVEIDCKGKYIYPGLIDMYTAYGQPEVKRLNGPTPQYESAASGATGWNQAIKPETDASAAFTADTKAADEYRRLGFSTVMTLQKDGIARGTAAVVLLGDGKENELMITGKAAACYSFDKGVSNQEYPGSLMGAIALLRQTYYDAKWYKSTTEKKEYNLSLEAWNNTQSLMQVFETTDKLNVLRADKVGDEFGVQYVFKGSGNEYQRIDEIKATNGKFILPVNLPMAYDVEDPFDADLVSYATLKHWEMAPLNLSAFEQNKIDFAITASDLKDKKDFWKNLRKCIQAGLTEKTALRAMTTIPAQMLGLSSKTGSLKKGMMANFMICSANLFSDKNVIYENWIQGKSYVVNDMNVLDVRGTYDMMVGSYSYSLDLSGEPDKLKAALKKGDSAMTCNFSVNENLVSLSFYSNTSGGVFRLSGSVETATMHMSGKAQRPDGTWTDWMANRKAAFTPPAPKPDSVAVVDFPKLTDVPYPFSAYGNTKANMPVAQTTLFRNATVWTNEADSIRTNCDVLVTNGKITSIGTRLTAPTGARVIEASGKHLTPGIIDEHSHIGVSGSVNEGTQSSSAEVRIGDVINCDDINIYRQLSGGVIACQQLHGSANPIGGQSSIIKLRWGASPEKMKIQNADGFIKFALGENVKQSNWGDAYSVRFPQTRMGVEQTYYDYFTRAKEYDQKMKTAAASTRRDLDLEAIAEILNKKRFITCHSYVQSEINMLMHVGDSMGFRVNTFTHILEGYKVADKLKAHGAGASSFSDWWSYKMEVREAIPYNAAILTRMGVVTAINSDDAEMARRLNQEAAKSVKYGGLTEVQALKLVTLNPAKLLHLDKFTGSVKAGKDADLVLWSDNPLSIYAKAEITMIDGVVYYDAQKDFQARQDLQKDRTRIIQKMIAEKNGGAPVLKPKASQPKLQHCDSEAEGNYLEEQQ